MVSKTDGKEKLLVKWSLYFLGFFIFPKLDKFLKHGERKKTYIEILNVHKIERFHVNKESIHTKNNCTNASIGWYIVMNQV
jgi:hypothetical protein